MRSLTERPKFCSSLHNPPDCKTYWLGNYKESFTWLIKTVLVYIYKDFFERNSIDSSSNKYTVLQIKELLKVTHISTLILVLPYKHSNSTWFLEPHSPLCKTLFLLQQRDWTNYFNFLGIMLTLQGSSYFNWTKLWWIQVLLWPDGMIKQQFSAYWLKNEETSYFHFRQ
jgi:hypothetical protein